MTTPLDLRTGDRLLTLGKNPLSPLLAWWLGCEYSHITPVMSRRLVMNITWPRPTIETIEEFLAKQRRVLHLRPTTPFNSDQGKAWTERGNEILATDYDLLSFKGHLANDGKAQNGKKYNCAEGVLSLDHAAGLLLGRDFRLISPQSYVEFAAAGVFVVVE